MLLTSIFAFFALQALAQQQPTNFVAGPITTATVRNAPFSAEGTQSTTPLSKWKFYRDSEGRTRIENESETTIKIIDPVAGLQYQLDSKYKIAHRRLWQAPPQTAAVQQGSLGTKTIEGLLCEGTRDETTEIWTSKELQLILFYKTAEQIQKLVNISRAEPPAELFKPPSAYALEDYGRYISPVNAQPDQLGVYSIGGDVSAPTLTSKSEPVYSAEALQAKLEGRVLLSIIVDINGVPRDIKVVHPLGLGLDEKAIEAVLKWRFKPALRSGQPVPVKAQVEVSFRLYKSIN